MVASGLTSSRSGSMGLPQRWQMPYSPFSMDLSVVSISLRRRSTPQSALRSSRVEDLRIALVRFDVHFGLHQFAEVVQFFFDFCARSSNSFFRSWATNACSVIIESPHRGGHCAQHPVRCDGAYLLRFRLISGAAYNSAKYKNKCTAYNRFSPKGQAKSPAHALTLPRGVGMIEQMNEQRRWCRAYGR